MNPLREAAGGLLAGVGVAAFVVLCAAGAAGTLAFALYLHLAVRIGGAQAALWAALLLAALAGMAAWLLAARLRTPAPPGVGAPASAATPGAAPRHGALLDFVAREPLWASGVALAAGIVAARSPALRELIEDLLREAAPPR